MTPEQIEKLKSTPDLDAYHIVFRMRCDRALLAADMIERNGNLAMNADDAEGSAIFANNIRTIIAEALEQATEGVDQS